MTKLYQVAAIPIRRSKTGAIEVLLVTSRETRRWVVPKGWPWAKLSDRRAAAEEAWEEAGVRGRIGRRSIGSFTYPKRRDGKTETLSVRTFLLEVVEQLKLWPEAHQRRRCWFAPEQAAELVKEPELKDLLLEVAQTVPKARSG